MPNIKSAKKRVKVISAKTLQNKMFKNSLRTIVKKFNAAVESGDKAAAEVAYKDAVKKIDQAAARGTLHKNNAAHKKSQFTLKLNNMQYFGTYVHGKPRRSCSDPRGFFVFPRTLDKPQNHPL